MRCFLGPLGHHKNYIEKIALPNCEDYYRLVEENLNSNKELKTPDKHEELRYFLNAAESLNNILEYMYIDSLDKIEDYKNSDMNKFKINYYKKYRFLGEINDISNAYKHRLRMDRKNKINKSKRHADDLMSNKLEGKIIFNQDGINIEKIKYLYDNNFKSQLIEKAYRHWIDYLNNN